MALLSVAAYAKTHNVSKAAAQKWEARGLLVKREGKVFVEASDKNLEFSGLGRFSAATGSPRPPATGNPVAVEVAAPAVARDDAGEIDFTAPATIKSLTEFAEGLLTGKLYDLMTAEIVRANALALTRVLNARREAGMLIDLETAEKILFEQARESREAWLNFPTRVAPMMAGELGVDQDRLVEVLSAHVHEQLSDIGDPEAKFGVDRPAEAGLPPGDDPAAADRDPGVG